MGSSKITPEFDDRKRAYVNIFLAFYTHPFNLGGSFISYGRYVQRHFITLLMSTYFVNDPYLWRLKAPFFH